MMRGTLFGLLILASLLLVACSVPPATVTPEADAEPEPLAVDADLTPEEQIVASAKEAFGVDEEAVLCVHQDDGEHTLWTVSITLQSVESTALVDQAACEVLWAASVADPSDTSIILSVVSRDLRFGESVMEWGSLAYQWMTMGRESDWRGETVFLFHSEAEEPRPPGGPTSGCVLQALPRGRWAEVTTHELQEWSATGAPPPSPWPVE